jgi:hypothetical protein
MADVRYRRFAACRGTGVVLASDVRMTVMLGIISCGVGARELAI